MGQILLPKRRCQDCSAAQKTEWGCTSDAPVPQLFDGKTLRRCPLRGLLDTPDLFQELFTAWQWREKGFLPEQGAWRDQPAKLPWLLDVMDRAIEDARDAERKRDESRRTRAAALKKGGQRPTPAGMTGGPKVMSDRHRVLGIS